MIKRLIAIMSTLSLVLMMVACSNTSGEIQTSSESVTTKTEESTSVSTTAPISSENTTESTQNEETKGTGKTTLVVYFSATGTTKGVAERIALVEDADTYEIVPSEPYSDADLNWNDKNSRTTKEQNDPSSRPGIASEKIDISGYSKIYVGYPIWWGEEPRIMDTFVETYDFGTAVVIPFCTSGGSGIGRSGANLAEKANGGNWIGGDRLNGSISEDEIRTWIDGLT